MCFYKDTILLTPSSLYKVSDLAISNKVLIYQNNRTSTYSITKFSNSINPLYKVTFSDGTQLIVSDSHLLPTRIYNSNNNYELKSIEYLRSVVQRSDYYVRDLNYVCCYNSCSINTTSFNGALEVRAVDFPFELQSNNLCSLPPYWIGVITIKGILEQKEPLIKLTEELKNSMNNRCVGERQHFIIDKPSSLEEEIYSFRSLFNINKRSQLSIDLENLGLLYSNPCYRYIHKSYLFTSFNNRLEILRGIIDSGGYINVHNGGGISIKVKSEKLMKDIYFLVRSLGGYAFIETIGNSYKLDIFLRDNPFSLSKFSINYRPPSTIPIPPKLIKTIEIYSEDDCRAPIVSGISDIGYISQSYIGLDFNLSYIKSL
jgi:hypothetical protein